MDNLSSLLPKHVFTKCFEHYKPEDFVNHSIGILHNDDHTQLIEQGSIVCDGERDTIQLDGFVVKVKTRDDFNTVFEGSLRDCQFEVEKIKQEKRTAIVKIDKYPKSYVEWRQKQNAKNYAQDLESESLENLIKRSGL